MPDPIALLPLALAAGGGRVDDHETTQLVAAGFTLLQRSAAVVRALDGRRAAILLPTSPQFLVALAASEGRGAVLVNPLASAPEIAHQLADADVGAVFTIGAFSTRLPESVTRVLLDDAPRSARVVAAGLSRDVDLGSHVGLVVEGRREAAASEEEAAVVYTSAMCGTPLGASLSHRNLISNARSTRDAAAIGPHDHVLALLPFSHLFGLTVTASAPLLAGARVTTMPRFNPVAAIETIQTRAITMLVGVPAVFHAMLSVAERKGRFGGALRLAICGGAVLDVALQDRWYDRTGVELRQGYGLTEAGPVCLFNPVERANARGSLGVPLPGVEVGIADPDGGVTRDGAPRLVPDGTRGDIIVRGDNVFRGYVSRGSDGLRLQGGWLRTGDLGVRQADGTVTFAGVAKAMFTRNGFNIYPREIESVVRRLRGVDGAEVMGVSDPVREHDIHLVVRGAVTEEMVTRWCEEQLAAYKQPSRITVFAARA